LQRPEASVEYELAAYSAFGLLTTS
jgi:hypothetical protein